MFYYSFNTIGLDPYIFKTFGATNTHLFYLFCPVLHLWGFIYKRDLFVFLWIWVMYITIGKE